MADTTTTTYGLTKIEVGASEDTWGAKLNTNFDSLDDLLDGTTVLTGLSLDDTATLVDNLDNTKVAQFQASGITTGTTRTFTFPDASGTIALTDATLTSIAALGTAGDKGVYFTGVDTAAEFDLTAAGRALLDDADASAQRTTLGLGTAALRAAEDTLTDGANLPDGAAVKAYVDAAVLPAAGDVGSLVWARYAVAADVAFGATVAGSDLNPTGAVWGINTFTSSSGSANLPLGTALSGTWRCLGLSDNTEGGNPILRSATLWQRTV